MVNRMSMVVEEAVRFNSRTPIKKIFTQMELRILLCWNIVGAAIAPYNCVIYVNISGAKWFLRKLELGK